MASFTAVASPEGSPESCPEFDADFFAKIEQSFTTVDVWEEGKSNDGSMPLPEAIVKTEKNSPESKNDRGRNSKLSRSRTDSDRSNTNRDQKANPNSRDKENGKKSRSPERRRSPYRRQPSRFSPPGGRRPRPRSRTPPRHVRQNSPPPRRNNQANRPSWLQEITEQIPALKQDMMMRNNVQMPFNNVGPILNHPNMMHGYGMNQVMPQMMHNQGYMQGQSFMQQQPYPNGPQFQPVMDPYSQPFPINQFNNIMSPMMAPGTNLTPINIDAPTPVPAPIEVPVYQSPMDPRLDPRTRRLELKKPAAKENDIQQAKKKAFDSGKISLSDYLRQVSNQTSKNASAADLNSKRAKVHERCKSAAKLLDELGSCTAKLPFILRPSKKTVPAMKSDPKLGFRSPLIMSDSNAPFMFQVKASSCRDALQANPLRNISSKLTQFGRNLGLDITGISQQVQRHVEIEREKEIHQSGPTEISNIVINAALKKGHQSTQTEALACARCDKRDRTKFETKSSQVVIPGNEIATQYEEEPDSFNVSLNARTMQTMSRDQQKALVAFCQAFNIHDERLEVTPVEDNRGVLREPPDDRMSYTNPENPNASHMFVSFSPERESPPRTRMRITDRLGQKVQSPPMQQFHDDDALDHASLRFYQSRQSPPISSYRIPSPAVSREGRYNRSSPYSSQGYRNQERTRSRSPSPLPVRRRSDRSRSRSPGPFSQRRGRY